jgi:RNA polymerase sigma-70 factor (ECF subfamily)
MTDRRLPKRVTTLLQRWRGGDEKARDELLEVVYPELHELARRHIASERAGHTLQATALVNEAFLRLVGSRIEWTDRAHFFAVAASAMRRTLVDHAKARRRAKRGGGAVRVTFDESMTPASPRTADVLAVDEALARLTEIDARKGRVIELHFFGGLTYDEIAHAIDVSSSTVKRELRFARAWLASELEKS